MTLKALVERIPPPVAPFEAFLGPWEPIEAAVGMVMPQDYKDFVGLYGSGYFMQFLGISVPQSANPNVDFVSSVRSICKTFEKFEDLLDPMWPKAGGLLPFGSTDNGDYLLWLTRGAPDEWPVVIWGRHEPDLELFECGLVAFLTGLVTGEIAPQAFPDEFLVCDHLFQASSPL